MRSQKASIVKHHETIDKTTKSLSNTADIEPYPSATSAPELDG